MTPSNLAIFREQYAPRTTRVVNTPDGTVTVYSALAVGVIEGKSRTIRALVCEEIGTEDRWFLVTLFVSGKYAQTVAVLGATSSEQAEEWVKRQFSYEYQGEYTSACSLASNGGPLTASADALQEYLDSAAAGVMDLPIRSADISAFEGKITDRPVGWNQDILISHATLADLIHELARRDKHGMMMDAMTAEDLPFLVAELGGEVPEFDAIIVDYNRLELMQERLMTAMHKASTGMEIKPMTVQQTKPFKRSGVTNVAVMYELSDGQTVTIVFHSPDATPAKLGPRDTLTSWKWMLNKRDVTAAVAPENGLNVQLPVLAKRIMMVAAKNSARFKRTNAKKAEQVQALNDTTSRIEQKTATLDGINAEIDTLQKQIDAGGNKISLTDITPDLLAKIPFGWGVSRGSDGLFFVTRFGRKYTVLNEKSVFSSANEAVEFAIDGDKTTDAPTQSEIEWAKKNGFVQVAPSGDDRNDAIDELAEIEMFKAVQNDDMAAAIATIEKAKAYGVDGVLKVLNTAYLNNLPMLSRIAKNYGISASGGAIPISAAVDDIVAAIMAGNVSSPSVPASVERQINAAVQNLQAKAKSLDQVIKVRGHGANLEQALAELQPEIDSSMATIQKIRDAAANNGASEEVERLITTAGGIPDFKQFQMPPDDGLSKDAHDAIDSMLVALQDDQELKGRIEQAVARMNIADISGDMVENWYKANSRTYLSGLPMSQMMRAAAEFKRRAVDAVNSIGNGPDAKPANDGRLTPDTAANLKRGDVVKTADGQEFLALGARHDWLEVAPIVNGKAQVNNQDTFKFLLTPEKASSYPERRNEPVYPTGRNLYAEQEKANADSEDISIALQDALADLNAPEGMAVEFDPVVQNKRAASEGKMSGFLIMQDTSDATANDLTELELVAGLDLTGSVIPFYGRSRTAGDAVTVTGTDPESLRAALASTADAMIKKGAAATAVSKPKSTDAASGPKANKTFDGYISLAADSIEKLRLNDIDRVLDQASSKDEMLKLATYMVSKRPSIRDAVIQSFKDVLVDNRWNMAFSKTPTPPKDVPENSTDAIKNLKRLFNALEKAGVKVGLARDDSRVLRFSVTTAQRDTVSGQMSMTYGLGGGAVWHVDGIRLSPITNEAERDALNIMKDAALWLNGEKKEINSPAFAEDKEWAANSPLGAKWQADIVDAARAAKGETPATSAPDSVQQSASLNPMDKQTIDRMVIRDDIEALESMIEKSKRPATVAYAKQELEKMKDSDSPAWHTEVPTEGLQELPKEKDGTFDSRLITSRIAGDAASAVTKAQKLGNVGLYAYYLPSVPNTGRHGIVRLFPDDQTPGGNWKLLDSQVFHVGMMTDSQIKERIVKQLGNIPILAYEDKSAASAAGNAAPAQAKAKADPDRTLLEGIINGTTSAADVDMDALIAIAEKYDGNPDMEGLVNQALDIVTQAELEAAKAIG